MIRSLIIIAILHCIFVVGLAQTKEEVFNFPVRPGTEEWKQLNTFEQRLNAFNIPEHTLSNMTTSSLIKTSINHPWFFLYLSRNSLQEGYNYLKTNFNGLRELESRNDACKEVLEIYQTLKLEDITIKRNSVDRGNYALRISFLEVLLANTIIKNSLLPDDELFIIKKLVEKYETKEILIDEYGTIGLSTNALVMARFMRKYFESFNQTLQVNRRLLLFTENMITINQEELDYIKNQAKKLLEGKNNEKN